MVDDGFEFQPPPRRETKSFEPPPWEKDAFEELERRRAEQTAAEQALGEAGQVQPEAQPAAQALPDARPAEPAVESEIERTPGQPVGPVAGEAATGEKADDRRVAAMLAELSAEEPGLNQGLWKVAVGAGFVLGAIGLVLVVWAVAALAGARRTGAVGLTGGLILLFFGAGFVVGALYLTVRTLRQRGVL